MTHSPRIARFVRPFVVAAALATAIGATLPAATAEACGSEALEPEDQVRLVVLQSFNAENRRDVRRLLALWAPDSKVTSVETTKRGPRMIVESIEGAARRWTSAGQPTRFSVESLSVSSDVASARVSLTRGGRAFEDVLFLTRGAGRWKITGDTSRLVDEVDFRHKETNGASASGY